MKFDDLDTSGLNIRCYILYPNFKVLRSHYSEEPERMTIIISRQVESFKRSNQGLQNKGSPRLSGNLPFPGIPKQIHDFKRDLIPHLVHRIHPVGQDDDAEMILRGQDQRAAKSGVIAHMK